MSGEPAPKERPTTVIVSSMYIVSYVGIPSRGELLIAFFPCNRDGWSMPHNQVALRGRRDAIVREDGGLCRVVCYRAVGQIQHSVPRLVKTKHQHITRKPLIVFLYL